MVTCLGSNVPSQVNCHSLIPVFCFDAQMYAPFVDDGDDLLSQVCQLQVFLSLLSSIILKEDSQNTVLGYLLPILIMMPPLFAVAFESGCLDLIRKATSSSDNGIPIPFSNGKRIGIGWRAKCFAFFKRLVRVKPAKDNDDEDDEEEATTTTGPSITVNLDDLPDGVPEGVAAAFLKYDTNKNGSLDYRELRNGLRFLAVDVSHPRAAELMARYDDTPDGKMELLEFAQLVRDLNTGMVRSEFTAKSLLADVPLPAADTSQWDDERLLQGKDDDHLKRRSAGRSPQISPQTTTVAPSERQEEAHPALLTKTVTTTTTTTTSTSMITPDTASRLADVGAAQSSHRFEVFTTGLMNTLFSPGKAPNASEVSIVETSIDPQQALTIVEASTSPRQEQAGTSTASQQEHRIIRRASLSIEQMFSPETLAAEKYLTDGRRPDSVQQAEVVDLTSTIATSDKELEV